MPIIQVLQSIEHIYATGIAIIVDWFTTYWVAIVSGGFIWTAIGMVAQRFVGKVDPPEAETEEDSDAQ